MQNLSHYYQGRTAYENGISRWAFLDSEFWEGVHRPLFMAGYEDAAQEDLDAFIFEISETIDEDPEHADYRP